LAIERGDRVRARSTCARSRICRWMRRAARIPSSVCACWNAWAILLDDAGICRARAGVARGRGADGHAGNGTRQAAGKDAELQRGAGCADEAFETSAKLITLEQIPSSAPSVAATVPECCWKNEHAAPRNSAAAALADQSQRRRTVDGC